MTLSTLNQQEVEIANLELLYKAFVSVKPTSVESAFKQRFLVQKYSPQRFVLN